VHGAYRTFGVVVPRDANDQHRAVDLVPLDEVRVGDLYFFGRDPGRITHVGFATSSASDPIRTMLHAPEDSVRVTDEALVPERVATLVAAGRVTMQTTSGARPGWS
jgi:cell wall-associated NlpC family hydrolase